MQPIVASSINYDCCQSGVKAEIVWRFYKATINEWVNKACNKGKHCAFPVFHQQLRFVSFNYDHHLSRTLTKLLF